MTDPRNTTHESFMVSFGRPVSAAQALHWVDSVDDAIEKIRQDADGVETMSGTTRDPENYFVTKVTTTTTYEDVEVELPTAGHLRVTQELRAMRENIAAAGTLNGSLNKMSILNRIDAILSNAPKE